MGSWLVWAIVTAVALLAADRLLLRAEACGWINWRRTGFRKGAGTYHLLEWSSAFDPSLQPVIEASFEERRQEDDAGAPPAGGGDGPVRLASPAEEPEA